MTEEFKVTEVNPNGMHVRDLVKLLEGVDPAYSVYFICRDHGSAQLASGCLVSHLQRSFDLLPVGQDYKVYRTDLPPGKR